MADTPLVGQDTSYEEVTDRISEAVLHHPTRTGWIIVFVAATALALAFLYAVLAVFAWGVGRLGLNIPIAWGYPIVNVVWWIGIGHAGTLISAVLLLLRQPWRASINRFAEAMTIFAASIAALFPIIHLGRPWFFYWLVPYPNTMELWPQWRSPLVWDFFAIGTYITVSLLFWYMGLIPDLAALRHKARGKWSRRIYGILALGWRGAGRHWRRHQQAYLILAALATPLVVSVHSVISLDFAVTIAPGYHSTIFPPYFVAGALYSGFAMVVTIAIPLRHYFGLTEFITRRHIELAAKVMIAAGLLVAYGYLMEYFMAWYSGTAAHREVAVHHLGSPVNWVMMIINVGAPFVLMSGRVRANEIAMFTIAILVNVGMWLERYVIVVAGMERDYLPSAWGGAGFSWFDGVMLTGSLGLFAFLMLLTLRLIPAISMYEVRELIEEEDIED